MYQKKETCPVYYARISKYVRNSHFLLCLISWNQVHLGFLWENDFSFAILRLIMLNYMVVLKILQVVKISRVIVTMKIGFLNVILVNKYLALIIFK